MGIRGHFRDIYKKNWTWKINLFWYKNLFGNNVVFFLLCAFSTDFSKTTYTTSQLNLRGKPWHCQCSLIFSIFLPKCTFQEVRPTTTCEWNLLRSLLGSLEKKWAMNNECFFVATLLSGQPKLFLLYGKSTLGEIFPDHMMGSERQRTLPSVW